MTGAATARTRTADVLAVGNAAKLYCLQRIEELAVASNELRIVDLGAGDGRNFVTLLQRHPHVTYVAVDPSADACAAARRLLPAAQATVVQRHAYAGEYGPADVVVSFSVLEHVYRRAEYVRLIAETLAPGGVAFVNYDSGHFRLPLVRDRVKNRLGPLLARVGFEGWYQAFVPEERFRTMVDEAGLVVREAASFNTAAKDVYRLVLPEARAGYMRAWLEFELLVNDVVAAYTDAHSATFRTRNFVLARAGV